MPTVTDFGSSPLSRGIQQAGHQRKQTGRIIPALAGNTSPLARRPVPRPDHPRSRGEYHSVTRGERFTPGSSPLSRGIPSGDPCLGYRTRIIPALAGNTAFPDLGAFSSEDHPRSRGEYAHIDDCLPTRDGSSPLSRGIRVWQDRVAKGVGIIPALAGNTYPKMTGVPSDWDHPRSRGEYRPHCRAMSAVDGSSPLSRGIQKAESARLVAARIIPALAGNTTGATPARSHRKDHPRSRGEYAVTFCPLLTRTGSSPLSRGIRRFFRPLLET